MLAILTFRSTVQTPDQVLERLRSGLEVEVDAEAGRAKAEKELTILRRLRAPTDVIEMYERGVEQARWVTVGDGSSTVELLLMPEANIRIDHDDDAQEGLVHRCAQLLDCVVDGCG